MTPQEKMQQEVDIADKEAVALLMEHIEKIKAAIRDIEAIINASATPLKEAVAANFSVDLTKMASKACAKSLETIPENRRPELVAMMGEIYQELIKGRLGLLNGSEPAKCGTHCGCA